MSEKPVVTPDWTDEEEVTIPSRESGPGARVRNFYLTEIIIIKTNEIFTAVAEAFEEDKKDQEWSQARSTLKGILLHVHAIKKLFLILTVEHEPTRV